MSTSNSSCYKQMMYVGVLLSRVCDQLESLLASDFQEKLGCQQMAKDFNILACLLSELAEDLGLLTTTPFTELDEVTLANWDYRVRVLRKFFGDACKDLDAPPSSIGDFSDVIKSAVKTLMTWESTGWDVEAKKLHELIQGQLDKIFWEVETAPRKIPQVVV